MKENQLKGITIYLEWLENYLKSIKTNSVHEFDEIVTIAPIPDYKCLPGSDPFKKLVEDFELNTTELFILLLSLSPIYIQSFLNSFFHQADMQSIAGSRINGQFKPTVATALDLTSGDNKDIRTNVLQYFLPDSNLISYNVIRLLELTPDMHLSDRPMVSSDKILERLATGKESKYNFSSDFPAILLETSHVWSDLVLGYDTRKKLQEIEEWSVFEKKMQNSDIQLNGYRKGYKCLYHGPSGTGKTLAASLIGKSTGKPVYKIDLSAMVSKYIGETEKNLRKVFDKADHGKWILFFDEADSLFGKRGQTKNAQDRYANQEVSYLLQRFETYQGIAILASNLKENIDVAFNRRFDNVINFKIPDADERVLLWEKHLPPTFKFEEGVDLVKISHSVKITGGQIHNVMKRCIIKSVIRDERIIMGKDMLESVEHEYSKENKIF